MKSLTKVLVFLLLAALPFSLLGQTTTVIAAFMKVTPGQNSEYLEVEQEWKKFHQRAVEEGVYMGWQLWRKLHAGANDPYDYITLQWYDSYESTFGENVSYDWVNELYSEDEQVEMMGKTVALRTYAIEEVNHQVLTAENNKPAKFIIVNRMKVKPGMQSKYIEMEKEIFKPLYEEEINRGLRAHWGVWNLWPFAEGQATITSVDGYADVKQLTAPSTDILSEVHPEKNWEEIQEMILMTREMISSELWELVDQVFLEE
jgi:hypothetical protein